MDDLLVEFQYLEDTPKWDSEKPYYISGPLPPSQAHLRTNLSFSFHSVHVEDLRDPHAPPALKKKVALETHGFELSSWRSPVPLTLDGGAQDRTNEYMEEVANWLKKRLGAELAIAYAYRYRHVELGAEDENAIHEVGTRVKPDSATICPHTDQTREGGYRRARHHMNAAEAEKYLNNPNWRVRIINMWRPIGHPVEDAPLAFCDYRSVQDQDLVASDRVSVEYTGEVYYLKYSERHKWYFFSQQTPDEVAVFASFDSDPRDDIEFCAHASFKNPFAPEDTMPRQSMEVRVIVITENTNRA